MSKQVKQAVVIIPTYQPSDALVRTVHSLRQAQLPVVVVDDGGGKAYEDVFSQLPGEVQVLHCAENKGKGAALKTAYAHVANEQSAQLLVTADADGQHSVEDIKNLIAVYQKHPGSLLLGVRKFDESHVPLKSRLGNVITRKVLSFITGQKMTDTQTGLRAFDTSLLPFMRSISGDRFEYETNVLLACSRERVPVIEEPIQTIYEQGNPSSHFNAVRDSWAIYGEIAKFMSSSLLAFAVDYLLFIILLQLTSSWALAGSVVFANIAARVVSASVNFSVNRRLVFRHKGSAVRGATQYALLAAGILLANTSILSGLTFLGIAPFAAKIITEIVLIVLSYSVQKRIIFSRNKDAGAKTQKLDGCYTKHMSSLVDTSPRTLRYAPIRIGILVVMMLFFAFLSAIIIPSSPALGIFMTSWCLLIVIGGLTVHHFWPEGLVLTEKGVRNRAKRSWFARWDNVEKFEVATVGGVHCLGVRLKQPGNGPLEKLSRKMTGYSFTTTHLPKNMTPDELIATLEAYQNQYAKGA